MILKRPLKELQGSSAQRAIRSCLDAMDSGKLSSRHIREIERCRSCQEMLEFERFLYHKEPMVSSTAAMMLARVEPEKVVEAVLVASSLSELNYLLSAIEKINYKDLGNLTPLLRLEDDMMVEKVFQTFINVGRSDLLFGMAVSGDDKTTKRIKRYLHEQGFIK